MPERAADLIETLALQPHPEGGHYRRVFTSERRIRTGDERGERAALSVIHYLLRAGEFSRLHRVCADEIWHFHEGGPLELVYFDADLSRPTRLRLGPAGGETRPAAAVPAGRWQCARPLHGHTLVSCSVAPAFDYADFELMRDCPQAAATLAARVPDYRDFL